VRERSGMQEESVGNFAESVRGREG
jgi:hypothetical protein